MSKNTQKNKFLPKFGQTYHFMPGNFNTNIKLRGYNKYFTTDFEGNLF